MARALAALLALAFGTAGWQDWHTHRDVRAADLRLAAARGRVAASAAAPDAAPRDLVQTKREPPSASAIMGILQRAADQEGARVVSLQAEDHPATPNALGHLDLVLSIRATYPKIVVVLQQVLDRYPASTLRQFSIAHGTSPTGTRATPGPLVPGRSTPPPDAVESEAHLILAFWSPPQTVPAAGTVPPDTSAAPWQPDGGHPGRAR